MSKTVDALIRELQAETGAPDSLAAEIRDLFISKGIEPDADAVPFAAAIRDTFLRAAELRLHSERARSGLVALQERLERLSESWERNLSEARAVRDTLRVQGDRLREQTKALRAFGVRQKAVLDNPPLARGGYVPGPKDLQ